MNARVDRAAARHRQAAAIGVTAAAALDRATAGPAGLPGPYELADRLRDAAARLAPGWAGDPFDGQAHPASLGGTHLPGFVRVGTAHALDDVRFPAIVPIFGTGHLSIDADCRDPRVAGLLRAVTLRLLAAAPAGALLVRPVAVAATAAVFAPFAPLADAGLMAPPATDHAGLRAVLTEAERWVRPSRSSTGHRPRRDRTMLLIVAALPEPTGPADLLRIEALARSGPDSGLYLIVAGWPPLTPGTTRPPLPRATAIALGHQHALLGDPPGVSFADPTCESGDADQPGGSGRAGQPAHGQATGSGLNAPVFLDGDPPARLTDRVCRELTARVRVASRHGLADLLPERDLYWAESGASGLTTTVGYDADVAVTLRFTELTPHWLVGGRTGAGKTAFLANVVYGLCARYPPEALALRLASPVPAAELTALVAPAGDAPPLPHLAFPDAADGTGPEPTLVLLRTLAAEVERRLSACRDAGVARFDELPHEAAGPRILCLVDDLQTMPESTGKYGTELLELLASIARGGRTQGIHLLLALDPAAGPICAEGPTGSRWTALPAQFPVRVVLPGGDALLEPANYSAAGLPLGTAVVNTAGGLGGPRGATRGHERVVQFPDPRAEPDTTRRLRDRLGERGRNRPREVNEEVAG